LCLVNEHNAIINLQNDMVKNIQNRTIKKINSIDFGPWKSCVVTHLFQFRQLPILPHCWLPQSGFILMNEGASATTFAFPGWYSMVQSILNKFYQLSLSYVQLLLRHQILQTFVTNKDLGSRLIQIMSPYPHSEYYNNQLQIV
jgi:hypothetical protein